MPNMAHWRVLAAVGSMSWGVYFIYDMPATLSIPLSKHLSLSEYELAYLVSLLYTIYAIPNTILPFFSGAAVQRFGERTVLASIMSSIILGQLLFALAVHTKFEIGLIIGRAFIGFGGEVVGVLGCEIITRWFQDRNLSLALAINLGAGRLGSVANTLLVPRLSIPYGVVAVTWIATVISLGVSAIGAIYILTTMSPTGDEDAVGDEDIAPLRQTPDTNFVSSILHFRTFPRVFWHLSLICLLGYGCLNTFTNSGQRFLATRFYHDDQLAAGEAMSVLFIFSGILVPPFGFLLDIQQSTGYPRALIGSNILLILAHGIFLTGSGSGPILPLCLLGSADALFGVALWAGVARCLLFTAPATSKSLLHDETGFKSGYDTIPSSTREIDIGYPYLNDDDTEEVDEENEEINPGAIEARRTLGLGIITSLVNISTVIIPVPLAVMESIAGFKGLEAVFLVLGVLGCLASGRLWWVWDRAS
ncbi:major facilitator superfamily domain-containing protein [Aspergillus californicus]